MKKIKGIWLYGLSGTGKSYASNYLKKKLRKSIIIDGDEFRKYISFDLNYSLKHRQIQIKRIFGLSSILIKAGYLPIASSVYMNTEIKNKLKEKNILLILVRRNMITIMKNNKTYKNKKNIVGVDINYSNKLKTKSIFNNGDKKFCPSIIKLIK